MSALFDSRFGRVFALALALVVCLAAAAMGLGGAEGSSAGDDPGRPAVTGDQFPEKVEVDYAVGFDVEYFDTYKVVTLPEPWPGASEPFRYVLVQRGAARPVARYGDQGVAYIDVPIRSIVTMSTTYLSHLENLGLLESLVGHDSFSWVYSPRVRDMAEAGEVVEVGSGTGVNVELLIDLNPDVIMTYGSGSADFDAHPKLLEAGLPVVLNADFVEPTPLGNAEWVKFISLFYNAEAAANEFFEAVEARYTELAAMAREQQTKPTVLINAPWSGSWVVGTGDSFIARFIEDAGGDYVWADTSGSAPLFLDVESVLDAAADAEVWINPGQWRSLDQGLAEDERFTEFDAFAEGRVYNNDARRTEAGGSDYFESGPANPHVVLADLIRILHPDLVPEHELYYYRRLE